MKTPPVLSSTLLRQPSPRRHSERSSAPGFAGRNGVEESLTETRAEAVGVMASTFHQTASAHGESAILHYGLVRKASQASVQDDGVVRLTALRQASAPLSMTELPTSCTYDSAAI